MTTTEKRRVTWCLTMNAYADEATCHDGETGAAKVDHDHYDVALDQHGKTLFRYWPIGTTWCTPEGHTYRLRTYRRDITDIMAAEAAGEPTRDIPPRPVWDVWTRDGGATTGPADWLPGPEDVLVEYVLPPGTRPAPGALFVRPNGQMWRLRGYRIDWKAEPLTGDDTEPDWTVGNLSGGMSNGDDLPSDARLVWHP